MSLLDKIGILKNVLLVISKIIDVLIKCFDALLTGETDNGANG